MRSFPKIGKIGLESFESSFKTPGSVDSYFLGALVVDFSIASQGVGVIQKLREMEAGEVPELIAQVRQILGIEEGQFLIELNRFVGGG